MTNTYDTPREAERDFYMSEVLNENPAVMLVSALCADDETDFHSVVKVVYFTADDDSTSHMIFYKTNASMKVGNITLGRILGSHKYQFGYVTKVYSKKKYMELTHGLSTKNSMSVSALLAVTSFTSAKVLSQAVKDEWRYNYDIMAQLPN